MSKAVKTRSERRIGGKVPSFKLKATEEVISESVAQNSRNCTVAQSVRLGIPDSYSISVSDGWVRFNIGDHKEVTGTRYAYPLCGKALEAQRMLDDGRKDEIRPFAFTLQGSEGFMKPVEKTGPRPTGRRVSKKAKRARKAGPRRNPVRRYRGLSHVSNSTAA